MKEPAPVTWNRSGGRKALNVRPVVLLVICGVSGPVPAWLLGTYHGVSSKHLQDYLNEFVFRFNRRFWPMVAFDNVLKIAVRVEVSTHRDLYDDERTHPNPVKSRLPVLTG